MPAADPAAGLTWADRFAFARGEVRSILGRVWPYLLVGIALGAVIHGWVPEDALATLAGSGQPARRARRRADGRAAVLATPPACCR